MKNNGNAMGYYYSDPHLGHSNVLSYDSLNRLHTAVATGTSPANYNWAYGYDRWGNMQCSGWTGGVDTCAAMTYNTSNNRLTAIGSQTPTYDAAGNLLSDGTGTGSHSYTWDAEGRLSTVSSPAGTVVATYQYNALGQRVQASGSGVGPYPVFQYYDAFGNLGYHGDTVTWGYAPFPPVAGKVYGKYYGRTLFIHSNALGSTGTTTWQDGTWGNSEIYDPWGQRWATSGTLWDERFAGIDNVRDPESGLDQTQFRMLTSSYGRWLSPDPLAGDVSNPQSLNRYAYALNNPCSMVDPLGLDACNINTLIDNQAGQSVNVAAIESVIAQIFGASSLGQPDQVGVNFVTGGPANFTLTYNNNGVAGKRSGYATPGGNTGVVFANLYPVSVYGQHADTFLGVIGAHEMGHGLASVKDLPFQNGDVPALMSIDNNPSWDIPVSNGSFPEGLLFTPGQVEAMFHRCPNKHPSVVPLPLGGGGGGGQGGSDRGQWQMTIGNCGTTSGDGGQGWTCDIGYTWVPFPIQRK